MNTSSKRIGGIVALALLGTIASGVNAANQQGSPCPGYGMGPGMMHGWGTGPRSMWGGGDDGYMGRGMMYGQGPGMMNGYGPGSGLNLDESQQKNMTQIQDELRKKHWETMGKMNDENARLRDLYQADKRDPDAIGKQLQRIFDLRRQMMVDSVEAQNRMEEQLTEEQRKQLRNSYESGVMPQ